MIAMLLAAGRGERLRPVTDEIPKALVEVRGKSLLERHLEAVRAAGIGTVVINLGWMGDKIVDRVGSGAAFGLNVIYSPEGDNVLETGGGIHRALPMLGEDTFLVANADVYTDMPLPQSIADDVDAQLVLVPNPEYRDHGDFDLRNGRVYRNENRALTFSGVALYRPAFFAGCTPGRFALGPLLFQAADEGRLGGILYEGLWEDVGTPERLAAVNRG